MLAPFPPQEPGLPPELLDRLVAEGQAEEPLDPGYPPPEGRRRLRATAWSRASWGMCGAGRFGARLRSSRPRRLPGCHQVSYLRTVFGVIPKARAVDLTPCSRA
jgi:hypothetical protein